MTPGGTYSTLCTVILPVCNGQNPPYPGAGSTPASNFNWNPATIYTGDSVTFSDALTAVRRRIATLRTQVSLPDI